MTKKFAEKLATLPKAPGVYFHKDKSDEIIYVGKAAVLSNRVRQYFQNSRAHDAKTQALVAEIADTDWMVVDSEIEALFLEAEMIRRYMPRYNILLRDDKSMAYIRIDYSSDFPTVSTTRRPLDDGAKYFGPYLSAHSVRQALKALRRIFPFATARVAGQKRTTLFYHLGLDPGLEEGKTSLTDYRSNLRRLMAFIEGRGRSVEHELEKEMREAAKAQEFEKAATIRNQLTSLKNLTNQVIFSDKEFLDISKDHALGELVDILGLEQFPARIEGYDVSHQQGSDVVASMVVFTNGVSDKSEYRKFKTKLQENNDFRNMYETLRRRLLHTSVGTQTSKRWPKPSLVLIDGGKGQLEAAIRARDEVGLDAIPFIGLAKRQEQIVIQTHKSGVQVSQDVVHKLGGFISGGEEFKLIDLPHSTNIVKLLQRIRDESHRFAVSYHSTLKTKRQTSSVLDDIPTIGPATRRKLLKRFGSLRGVSEADSATLVATVGKKRANLIERYLTTAQPPNPLVQ